MRLLAYLFGAVVEAGASMARHLSSGYSSALGYETRPDPYRPRELSTGDVAMLDAFHRDVAIFTKGLDHDPEWVAGRR